MAIVSPMGLHMKYGIVERPIIIGGGTGKIIATKPDWFDYGFVIKDGTGVVPTIRIPTKATDNAFVMYTYYEGGNFEGTTSEWWNFSKMIVNGKSYTGSPATIPTTDKGFGCNRYSVYDLTPGNDYEIQIPDLGSIGVNFYMWSLTYYPYTSGNGIKSNGDLLPEIGGGSVVALNNVAADGYKYRNGILTSSSDRSPIRYISEDKNRVVTDLPITYSHIENRSVNGIPSHYVSCTGGLLPDDCDVFGTRSPNLPSSITSRPALTTWAVYKD